MSYYAIDGIPLVSGISCLLKQMHVSPVRNVQTYVVYKLSTYAVQSIKYFLKMIKITVGWDDGLQISEFILSILIFLEQPCRV